jgi:hypothetical protein
MSAVIRSDEMCSEAMRRSGARDWRRDDAERSDEEERRS